MGDNKLKKIIVDISSHGFGHLAQTAPVVNRLNDSYEGLTITIRSEHKPEIVQSFFNFPIHSAPLPREPSLEMYGPTRVDKERSLTVINEFHENWENNIALRAKELRDYKPDLVLSNIPYASIEAARQLLTPVIAMCSYNWFETQQFLKLGSNLHLNRIKAAYNSASIFLQPTPHMPMTCLSNKKSIGPSARRGLNQQALIRHQFNIAAEQKLILVTLGGVAGEREISLPDRNDFFWIVENNINANNHNMIKAAELQLPFIDILASCDIVVTKEGYGTLVESACNGVQLLMLTRSDWLETPYFVAWAERNASCQMLPIDHRPLLLEESLDLLIKKAPAPAVDPTGISEATKEIAMALGK